MGAAGTSTGTTSVENVFSTFLFDGNGGTQAIDNGIDLSGEGGMVWIKRRDSANDHYLVDTVRGAGKILLSNDAAQQLNWNANDTFKSFDSSGFTVGANSGFNGSGEEIVSWTFRKAPKFFDVVQFTTDSSGYAFTISHNLGTRPGFIITKRTDGSEDWLCGHRGTTTSGNAGVNLKLNSTAANLSQAIHQDLSDTSFTFIGGDYGYAANANYVSYLFADNSSEDAADRLISCGSYTGNGSSTGPVVNLGFEPQWVMIKNASYTHAASYWILIDNMRGMVVGGDDGRLYANENNAETQGDMVAPTSTGFNLSSASTTVNRNNDTYIYMAIRFPNMEEVTDATKVFDVALRSATSAYSVGFPTDLWIGKETTRANGSFVSDRLRGGTKYLLTPTTGAEQTDSGGIAVFDLQDSFSQGAANQPLINWNWKRAKGYFDVVCYTGTGSPSANATDTIAHGLTVQPEMVWVKTRSHTSEWVVAHKDYGAGYLNLDNALATYSSLSTTHNDNFTTTTFKVATWQQESDFNASGRTFIAYLFATLAGVSKVGSVTHSGSSTDVDCGFTSGARFVLLKRTDASGGWYIWDSARGIVAGNDPYLLLNDPATQVTNTDLIDPLSSGFQISGDFTDGDYIFYAVA